MLDIMKEISSLLSVIVGLSILKGLLSYRKEPKENSEIMFLILLLLTYIIVRITGVSGIHGSYYTGVSCITNILIFIIWGAYYRYFYKIEYIKYAILFCLFNIYYELIYGVLRRILFLMITGYSESSEKSFLISELQYTQIAICAYIVILFIVIIFSIFNKKLQLLDREKRNYIYLILALIVNATNIFGSVIFSRNPILGNNELTKILFEWQDSTPMIQLEMGYFEAVVIPKLYIASILIIVTLFMRITKENKIKSQEKLMKSKLEMQYSHYLSIQESHMKVRQLYHDINNHICCIDNLKDNSYEVEEYIKNLKEEIKDFKEIHNTGNMILDIIINEKYEQCSKKGINFICNINFSKVDFVKNIDISSIFSNILDNAIEACDKIQDKDIQKYIEIKGSIRKSYFVLKCENSKINTIKTNKNILLTDKKDKFIHGIGVNSIRSSLQKYNGEVLFEDKKDKFILNIYIPLNQNYDSWVD